VPRPEPQHGRRDGRGHGRTASPPPPATGNSSLQQSWPTASPPTTTASPSSRRWHWPSLQTALPIYRLLWALAPYAQQAQAEPWQLSLQAERHQSNPSSPAEHSLKLRFSLLF
ncbi:MAG: hypothetical protein OXG70_03910, partial [Cyanobacteria bacterium MAG IRC1_bin_28]|nr:hypothetical protein [Cyanobacteria bacterium MAG IRC1_bin_28]